MFNNNTPMFVFRAGFDILNKNFSFKRYTYVFKILNKICRSGQKIEKKSEEID